MTEREKGKGRRRRQGSSMAGIQKALLFSKAMVGGTSAGHAFSFFSPSTFHPDLPA